METTTWIGNRLVTQVAKFTCIALLSLLLLAPGKTSAASPAASGVSLVLDATPSSGQPQSIMIFATIANNSGSLVAPFTDKDAWTAFDLQVVDRNGGSPSIHARKLPSGYKSSPSGPISGGAFARRPFLLKPGSTYTLGSGPTPLSYWGFDNLKPGSYLIIAHVLQERKVRSAQGTEFEHHDALAAFTTRGH
jgi:hypothetical protein